MTQFIPSHDSNGTSNLSGLLSADQYNKLRSIDPCEVEEAFGAGIGVHYEPTRGYEDDEWYWTSSTGAVWGIGWRWGTARLRGRGPSQRGDFFWDRPSSEEAAEFVEFLFNTLR